MVVEDATRIAVSDIDLSRDGCFDQGGTAFAEKHDGGLLPLNQKGNLHRHSVEELGYLLLLLSWWNCDRNVSNFARTYSRVTNSD